MMGNMMGKEIRFCLVGCGMISRFHAQAIQATDGAVLAGVYDPFQPAREKAAQEYRVPMFSTYEDVLADHQIDVLCILTPNGTHGSLAVQALHAGKHVVVEKPVAINRDDLDLLERTAGETGLQFCVISQLRFSRAVQAVKKAVEEGAFGKIVSASLAMKYHRSEAYYTSSPWRGTWAMDGGGALMNQGIHGVDLLQYLAGSVKRVYGICKSQTKPIETEDSAVATLEFANGAVGTLEGSTTCTPGYPRRLEICGTGGSVVLEEDAIVRWDLPMEMPVTETHVGHTAAEPGAMDVRGHGRQIRNLVAAIRGEEKLLVDVTEGRKPVEIILGIYESARTGLPVELGNLIKE